MNIINNLEWYFGEPKYARNMKEKTTITKEELETIVFDDNIDKNVKFCFPLNDSFTLHKKNQLFLQQEEEQEQLLLLQKKRQTMLTTTTTKSDSESDSKVASGAFFFVFCVFCVCFVCFRFY